MVELDRFRRRLRQISALVKDRKFCNFSPSFPPATIPSRAGRSACCVEWAPFESDMAMDRKAFFRRSSRIAQQLGIGSIAVGILAALAKAWATYWLGPSVTVRDTPVVTLPAEVSPATVEDLLKSSPISLSDWQTRVEQQLAVSADGSRPKMTAEQRERLFRDYLGKEMIWEGFLDKANPESPESGTGIIILQESYAALHSNAILGPPFVRCWCPTDAVKRIADAERGTWVVIRGRLKNPILLGSLMCTDLEGCEVITSSKVRNVETALSIPPAGAEQILNVKQTAGPGSKQQTAISR